MRLYLIDVNKFMTWVQDPEKTAEEILTAPWAVPNFRWKVDSHPEPQQWVDGKHVVRWWFEEDPA